MKKILGILTMVALLAGSAFAQGISFDTFAATRTIVLDSPHVITVTAVALVTNTIADTHSMSGIAKIDFTCITNTVGGTLTVNVQGSQDQTNWTTLANVAYATATSITYTNTSYGNGSNLNATTVFNLPGVTVNPNAQTAGWATPWLNPALLTNTPSAFALTPNGVYTIGYNIDDAARYLRLVYTPGGTATNITVSAVLTAAAR